MKRKLLILLILMFFVPFVVNAEELKMDWINVMDGDDKNIKSFVETDKGEIVTVGYAYSNGDADAIITKYDKDGEFIWEQIYGGNGHDIFNFVSVTSEGNIIVVGKTNSTDINEVQNHGLNDIVIIEYNSEGTILWQQTWGGNKDDAFEHAIQTKDEGIIVVVETSSNDLENITVKGYSDIVILKYSKDGVLLWQTPFGGGGVDDCNRIIETKNENIVFVGLVRSNDIPDLTLNNSSAAVIVKYGKNGNLLWQKIYGDDSRYSNFSSVAETNDGGYVAVGHRSYSLDEDPWSVDDAIIVKYDIDGTIEWQTSWGGNGIDGFSDVALTAENDFIVIGGSDSTDIVGINNENYRNMAVIIKYNEKGVVTWQDFYVPEKDVQYNSLMITKDDGVIINVKLFEFDGELYNYINEDAIILKYNTNGYREWTKILSGNKAENFEKIIFTKNNELLAYGWTNSTEIEENIYSANRKELLVKYKIEYNLENITIENGTSTLEQRGGYGIITPTPNKGYEVDKIIIKDKEGNILDVEVTKLEDGTYSFELYTDVSVEVLFKEKIENPKTGVFDYILLSPLIGLFSFGLFILYKENSKSYQL